MLYWILVLCFDQILDFYLKYFSDNCHHLVYHRFDVDFWDILYATGHYLEVETPVKLPFTTRMIMILIHLSFKFS